MCTPMLRPIHHSPLSKLKRVFIPTSGSEVNGSSHASIELHKIVRRKKGKISTSFKKISIFSNELFMSVKGVCACVCVRVWAWGVGRLL